MLNFSEPVMVIDEAKTRANIKKIADKTRVAGNTFRPHFKTHQSAHIAEWFRDEGITSITVSSIKMAEYFASNGWKDILIAFLYIPQSIEQLNNLAASCNLSIVIDNTVTLQHLSENLKHPAGLWIKADSGYSRTGIPLQEKEKLAQLAQLAGKSEKLEFKGLLTHAGHSYKTCSTEELNALFARSRSRMKEAAAFIKNSTGLDTKLSWGDTPTCSVVSDLSGFDEIRCGNFVFYDLMQHMLKSCTKNDISAVLFCPVAGIYPERNEFVILGGAVHLSKDYLSDEKGNSVFGLVGIVKENNKWSEPLEKTYVKSLSQEHGVISTTQDVLRNIKHGDLVAIYPVHSCLTANLADQYISLSGQVIHNINSTS